MSKSIYYTDYRWPELQELAKKDPIIIIPIGQVEEHGPHLPVGTDVTISEETARLIAEKAQDEMSVLVMPTIWAGFSGQGLFKWPGTISLPQEIVAATLEHIILSLNKSNFKKIVILNSHGHHEGIMKIAMRRIADQCKLTVVGSNIWRMAEEVVTEVRESEEGGCCHAGEYETSVMLAMNKRVDLSEAVDEPVKPHSQFVGGDLITRHNAKVYWSTFGHSSSKTGTFGCPTKATKEKGEIIMQRTVEEYMKLMREINQA